MPHLLGNVGGLIKSGISSVFEVLLFLSLRCSLRALMIRVDRGGSLNLGLPVLRVSFTNSQPFLVPAALAMHHQLVLEADSGVRSQDPGWTWHPPC